MRIKKNLQLHTPGGLIDQLPAYCQRKRAVERAVADTFERHGYAFVSSPSLEYFEVFEGKGSIPPAQVYKLVDKNGDTLALRPDMTPAVARLAVTHDLTRTAPLRLCYIEKTFRNHERFQGRENEITQAGAELLGVSSPEADAEMIALAVQAFIASGLTDFRVDIGQVDFLPGVFGEPEFIEHMINRDYVAAERISGLTNLMELTGGADVLGLARGMVSDSKALEALDYLEEVYAILCEQGLGRHILLDLSMTGSLDYYTGIIFKGYAKGSGTTVADGGRYDRMLAQFSGGAPVPAVGFGIKVDGLLGGDAVYDAPETLVAYHESARAVALSTAGMMRRQGTYLENSLQSGTLDSQIAYAKGRGLQGILYFESPKSVLIVNLQTGQTEKLDIKELVDKC